MTRRTFRQWLHDHAYIALDNIADRVTAWVRRWEGRGDS